VISLSVRIGRWSHPLFLCLDLSVPWCPVVFVLWNWVHQFWFTYIYNYLLDETLPLLIYSDHFISSNFGFWGLFCQVWVQLLLLNSIYLEYHFPSPRCQSVCIFASEVCFCRQWIVWSYFLIHSVSLKLLIERLRMLTFSVIIKRFVLISPFFVLKVYCFAELIMFDSFLIIISLLALLVIFIPSQALTSLCSFLSLLYIAFL
jgi:hypothetical protein